jgi:hypothetical protein
MPLLLTESLDPAGRERAHLHVENCELCAREWTAYRDTWNLLGEMPELEVPSRVKANVLAAAGIEPEESNVIPFYRRTAMKWLAQAAAVVIIAGGSYFAGHRNAPVELREQPPTIASVTPRQVSYSIAESQVIPAREMSPTIQGRPDIQNVQFTPKGRGNVDISFDVTQHVTVTGDVKDKSMVSLLSYVLENEDSIGSGRQRAIDWVRSTYSDPNNADPGIARALATVLRKDQHEGVRIKAVETLTELPAKEKSEPSTREALIEALKNDPNPAVRIKAVEALANLARSGAALDPATVDTLRAKAYQNDENPYVRVKAAEALSNIHP